MKLSEKILSLKNLVIYLLNQRSFLEGQKILTARLIIDKIKTMKNINSLEDVEFKVFSQWGDDGIIQWLINNINIPNKTFIEFGVSDYRESNTRFLLMNNNWSGYVMDGSEKNIKNIRNSDYYWKYELNAKTAFITTENINELIAEQKFDPEIGILHIDIDGNDYWVWEEINVIKPIIVILEYNSVFGKDRAITVPYKKDFFRTREHYSNLYFGASLKALHYLSEKKGYAFIGSNSAGNNTYFIRKDKLNESVKEVSLDKGYVLSKVRESRDREGNLTYLTGKNRLELIKGLPVVNVITGEEEKL